MLNLSYPDQVYSSQNPPSNETLKGDLSLIESGHNALETEVGTKTTLTAVLDAVFPIGSIYTAIVSTNPGTLLGVGTWTAFGAGRVIVGHNASDTAFDTAEETGGAKTHTLQVTEMPSHNHGGATGGQSADHTHIGASQAGDQDGNSSNGAINGGGTTSGASNDHIHGITAQGGGGAHNNLQPYIVAYMWKRVS